MSFLIGCQIPISYFLCFMLGALFAQKFLNTSGKCEVLINKTADLYFQFLVKSS